MNRLLGLLGMEGAMLALYVKRRVSKLRWFALGVSLALSAGCYKYVPTTIEAVPIGDRVRALLSIEAQQDVQLRMGRLYTALEGKLLEKNEEQVLLSVPTVKVASEYGSQSLYERIDVSRQGIVHIDARELDIFRTVVFIGMASGAAAFLTAQAFAEGEPGSPNGDPPSGIDQVRGALLRLTLFRW